jgi:hypothetical protein
MMARVVGRLCRSNKLAVELRRYKVVHEWSHEDAEPAASARVIGLISTPKPLDF